MARSVVGRIRGRIDHRRHSSGRGGDAPPVVAFGGIEGVHREGGGMQVVVEQAGQRGPAVMSQQQPGRGHGRAGVERGGGVSIQIASRR